MRYRLAFNRMASALRLAGSIYVSLNSLSAEKSSRTTTSRTSSASRGTASSQSSGSGRTSRSNNPEGHNQYTKKSQDNR